MRSSSLAESVRTFGSSRSRRPDSTVSSRSRNWAVPGGATPPRGVGARGRGVIAPATRSATKYFARLAENGSVSSATTRRGAPIAPLATDVASDQAFGLRTERAPWTEVQQPHVTDCAGASPLLAPAHGYLSVTIAEPRHRSRRVAVVQLDRIVARPDRPHSVGTIGPEGHDWPGRCWWHGLPGDECTFNETDGQCDDACRREVCAHLRRGLRLVDDHFAFEDDQANLLQRVNV
jgi:hypothetical protein